MGIQDISVDDILSEIRSTSARKNVNLTDLDRVNLIIEDILTQKQVEQQKQELSLKEKKEVKEMIKAQSKSLTVEFAKISAKAPEILKHEVEAPKIEVQETIRSQEKTLEDTTSVSFEELSKKLNDDFEQLRSEIATPVIKEEKEEIVAKEEPVLTMTEDNYAEFKINRDKKIADFSLEENVIEPKIESDAEEILNSTEYINDEECIIDENSTADSIVLQREIEEKDDDEEIEYNSESDYDKVKYLLNRTKKTVTRSMVMMIPLMILAIICCFFKINSNQMTFFGLFAISTGMFAVINLILATLTLIVGSSVFSNAISSIKEGRPDKDIVLSITAVICIIFNVLICISPQKIYIDGVYMYTPVLIGLFLSNFIAKRLSIKRIIYNFEFVASSAPKYVATKVRENSKCYEYTSGFLAKQDKDAILIKNSEASFLSDFIKISSRADSNDELVKKLMLFSVAVGAVAIAAAVMLGTDIYVGISAFVLIMMLSCGFLGFMLVDLVTYDSSDVVSYFAGTTPEYPTIEEYSDINSILVDAGEIFKEENIILHGIKTFEGKRIDDAILDAASVVCVSNSVLKYIFLDIIANKTELLKKVDTIVYEDLMGISAWVDDRRVLIGNRDLMINHSVAVPKIEFEQKYQNEGNQVVYLSNGGELSAVFVIELKSDGDAGDMISMLYKNDITVILKTVDSFITADLMHTVFNIPKEYCAILPARMHVDFNAEQDKSESEAAELCNNGSMFGFAVMASACKKLFSCIKFGKVLLMIQAILGALGVLAAIFIQQTTILSSFIALAFILVFFAVYWIYEKNINL